MDIYSQNSQPDLKNLKSSKTPCGSHSSKHQGLRIFVAYLLIVVILLIVHGIDCTAPMSIRFPLWFP